MKIPGIYAILNIVDDKMYVGNSSNLKKRWSHHRSALNLDCHYCIYLQRAWNKHGASSFIFIVLEYTSDLALREQFWIDQLSSNNSAHGYNSRVMATSNAGFKWSDDSKSKLSVILKTRTLSEENKRQISKTLTGRKMSDEARANMSKARKGKPATNRDKKKWPHELGIKCKCAECEEKLKEYRRQYRFNMIGSWL